MWGWGMMVKFMVKCVVKFVVIIENLSDCNKIGVVKFVVKINYGVKKMQKMQQQNATTTNKQ